MEEWQPDQLRQIESYTVLSQLYKYDVTEPKAAHKHADPPVNLSTLPNLHPPSSRQNRGLKRPPSRATRTARSPATRRTGLGLRDVLGAVGHEGGGELRRKRRRWRGATSSVERSEGRSRAVEAGYFEAVRWVSLHFVLLVRLQTSQVLTDDGPEFGVAWTVQTGWQNTSSQVQGSPNLRVGPHPQQCECWHGQL